MSTRPARRAPSHPYPYELASALIHGLAIGDIVVASSRLETFLLALDSTGDGDGILRPNLAICLEGLRRIASTAWGVPVEELPRQHELVERLVEPERTRDVVRAFANVAKAILQACATQPLLGTAAAAKAYIHEHCGNPALTVALLAEEIDRSAGHVITAFRDAYGVTPGAHLLQVRIDRAKILLAATALPIREIVRRCGFTSTRGFRAAFKRLVGCSPGEYRRRCRAEELGRAPEQYSGGAEDSSGT